MQIDSDFREVFKRALVDAVAANPNTTRENVIGYVFNFLDSCIAELLEAGFLILEPDPRGESHMDAFIAAAKH